ncbi:YegP family protein [Dyadobacter sp. CY347]|uniref:YegP family protein n=1 Tax=Dyadobacter sp. CY347 TaxID=2909336 RepID=UPI001F1F031B|nr:YegP family protein [Dyadobacter sp. CY347]MCF2487497.1 YegP family protein [Dyadobacter sp. CY347]
MGKYIIKHRSNGEFQFNLKAGNGEIILTSEGYETKAGCKGGIQSVRNNCQDDSRYERINATTGRYRFVLKATNGQIIGTSENYESSSGMNSGIESVKLNGTSDDVDDQAS